jgi:hypothetical protein
LPVNYITTSEAAAVCAPVGSGPLDTTQATSGTAQNGCFAVPVTSYGGAGLNRALVQKLPSAAQVKLVAAGYEGYDSGILQISPNSYSVTLHVGNTLTLLPVPADCLGNETAPVAPNTSQFQFRSRQRMVVKTNQDPKVYTPTCTLTTVGIGITEVVITSFRNVNNSIPGSAVPSGTEGVQCQLVVRVVA